jgi:phosphoserine aminotransferase
LLEWKGERASVMEVSHRGQAFIDCAAEAERDLRELMAIPSDYAVLFLQGGATTVSALLPLNLAGPDAVADYVLTGHWGEKALRMPAFDAYPCRGQQQGFRVPQYRCSCRVAAFQ